MNYEFNCSPPVGNTPERIQFLKDSIQSNYDRHNWDGNQHAKILMIAAHVELIGYGITFEPEYNCPA